MKTTPENTYRRFLLDIASEKEEARAEEAILAGEVDAQFLNDVEDELIDDYLLGSFTREERQGFAANFLSTDERRERVAFVAALVEYARKQPLEDPEIDRKPTWASSLVTALFWKRIALLSTTAALLLVAFVSFKQIQFRQQRQIATESQNELTRLRAALAAANSESSHPDTVSSVSPISPQTGFGRMPTIEFAASTRGVTPALLQIPAGTRFIRIDSKLSLPLADKYREVVLTSVGDRIWVQEFPSSILSAARHSTIVLPASILQPGLYHFQIERAPAKGQFELSEDHVFRVVRE